MPLKEILSSIILSSTIHGLPSILRTKRSFLKFIWFFCTIISSAICAFMLTKSITDYFDYDLVTTTSVKVEIPLAFPKIKICNSNPLLTDKAIEFINKTFQNWNVTNKLFYQLYENPPSTITYTQMNLFISKLVILSNAQKKILTDEFRKSLGLTIEDMLVSCFFGTNTCFKEDFEWIFDSLGGNCYIFNKYGNRTVTKEGILNGLILEIFVGKPLSIQNLATGSGISVFINNQSVNPLFFAGYDISTGMQTNIHLDKLRIHKINKPYGECTKSLLSIDSYDSYLYRITFETFNQTYQQNDCLNMCLQEEIVSSLGCYSTFFPYSSTTVEPCLEKSQITFVFLIINTFYNGENINQCLDDCPLECESESYSITSSFQDYPSEIYANFLSNQKPILERYGNQTPSYSDLKSSFLKLNINYQNLQYTLIEESQKTTWIDLVANIGGTLGLFLGLSFLSFVEFFEILFETILYFYKFNKNKISKFLIQNQKY